MNDSDFEYRLIGCLNSKFLSVFKNHPRLPELLIRSRIANERLHILAAFKIKCYNLNILIGSTEQFLRLVNFFGTYVYSVCLEHCGLIISTLQLGTLALVLTKWILRTLFHMSVENCKNQLKKLNYSWRKILLLSTYLFQLWKTIWNTYVNWDSIMMIFSIAFRFCCIQSKC